MVDKGWSVQTVIPLAKTARMVIRHFCSLPVVAFHDGINDALFKQNMINFRHLTKSLIRAFGKPFFGIVREPVIGFLKAVRHIANQIFVFNRCFGDTGNRAGNFVRSAFLLLQNIRNIEHFFVNAPNLLGDLIHGITGR